MKDRKGLDTSYLGGPFDRQVRIEDWEQKEVQKQAVLILGIGGLGSTVALSLLRLGVGKLFLLDYDVVDVHNLNRQLLFTHEDVGKSKVESALKNSKFHNAGNTQIEIFHGNALTNWKKVLQFAKQSTFVYNCIDYGDKFDAAVSSLCVQLKIPLVMGGTFSASLTIDFFNPICGEACYLCLDDTARIYESIGKITPEKILQYEDISFLPKNNNPIGRSSVVVCALCGQLMAAYFLNWLFLGEKPIKTQRMMFYHSTMEIMKFQQLQIIKDCPFCGSLNKPYFQAKQQKDRKERKEKYEKEQKDRREKYEAQQKERKEHYEIEQKERREKYEKQQQNRQEKYQNQQKERRQKEQKDKQPVQIQQIESKAETQQAKILIQPSSQILQKISESLSAQSLSESQNKSVKIEQCQNSEQIYKINQANE